MENWPTRSGLRRSKRSSRRARAVVAPGSLAVFENQDTGLAAGVRGAAASSSAAEAADVGVVAGARGVSGSRTGADAADTSSATGTWTAGAGLAASLGFTTLLTNVSDDFNGTAGTMPDYNVTGNSAQKWHVKNFTNGNSGTVYDLAVRMQLDGAGNLEIRADKVSGVWRSGFLSGNRSFVGEHFMEVRAKCPSGNGPWSQIAWTWDAPFGSNHIEIDTCEQLGMEPTAYHSTVHIDGTLQDSRIVFPGGTVTDAFHKYAAAVYDDHVDFYFDDALVQTISHSDFVGIETPPWPFHTTAMVINLSLDMGGWGGTPGAALTTKTLVIDYIRVYQ